MTVRVPRQGPSPRSVRAVNGVLAALYFFVCGMLVFFRLGPFRRVVARFQEQETPLPGWFVPLFTWGIVIIAVYIFWRGIRALKAALGD